MPQTAALETIQSDCWTTLRMCTCEDCLMTGDGNAGLPIIVQGQAYSLLPVTVFSESLSCCVLRAGKVKAPSSRSARSFNSTAPASTDDARLALLLYKEHTWLVHRSSDLVHPSDISYVFNIVDKPLKHCFKCLLQVYACAEQADCHASSPPYHLFL